METQQKVIILTEPVSVSTSAKILEAEYGDNVNAAIAHMETFSLIYFQPPVKPRNPKRHLSDFTSKELIEYAKDMEVYETALVDYNTNIEEYKNRKSLIYSIIEEYIREVSGLNDIPEQYRDKVYSRAYSEGHSYGFSEIYNVLVELVNIFN